MAFTANKLKPTTFNKKDVVKSEEQKITCNIARFIYEDEDTGFFVFLAQIPENQPNPQATVNGQVFSGRKFAVVGNSLLLVQTIVEGQEVEVIGQFEPGKQDGSIQFTATNIMEIIPTKPKAIELFLGSGKIPGIGPKLARKVVTVFGAKTLDILDKNPELLLDINGINEKKLEGIKKSWNEWRSIYEIVSTMQLYGVGDVAGVKIFNHFKERSIWVIKNDPYSLTDVDSIGFKTADKIAQSIGISPLDEKRIEKCILYTLEEISQKGHTAFPSDDLVHSVNDYLNIDENLIKEKINILIEKGDLIEKTVKVKVFKSKFSDSYNIVEKNGVAHKKFHNTEVRIARELKRLMDYPVLNPEINSKTIEDFLYHNPDELDDSQINAAKIILSSKVSILTGGPGTGKTHTIKSLLRFFDSIGIDVENVEEKSSNSVALKSVLCAPTGRAGKRMEEATNRPSGTIHRLLGFMEGEFVHNENNKLKGDVFIVDESSMNDIWIQSALLKAIPSHAILIFVGDDDQLPSVGPGKCLRDMIDSEKVPVAKLSVIHRQALNSNIIVASHAIIHKQMPELHSIDSTSDFVFVEKSNNEDIHDEIICITSKMVSEGISPDDIQVLTPKKATEVGTVNLNNTLRGILNPNFINYQYLETKFVPGDRVMQHKNNKELALFNGDVGKVVSVDEDTLAVKVRFDDKDITMMGQELSNLHISNAITIHKSQGSDYPYVIIPISKSHTFMWDANLLYTAITRGKKRVILVGDKKTLVYSVANFKQNDRITGLKNQIIEVFDNTNDLDNKVNGIKKLNIKF